MCLVLTLTMLSGFGFFACTDGEMYGRGISNFDPYASSVGINYIPFAMADGQRVYLFDLYKYSEGDYFYYCMNEMASMLGMATCRKMSLAYFIFEESVYEEVKQFSLEEIKTSEEKIYVYGGYTFLVDNSPYLGNSSYWKFPERLLTMAFNDETNTLVFFGFYISDPDENDQKVLNDLTDGNIAPFLEEYFVNLLLAKHGVQA